MARNVFERFGHTFDGDLIVYDERPVAWDRADAIAGRRLDRRKNYRIIDGQVCSEIRWTRACSGCSDGSSDIGSGCEECGYHGRVRAGCWMPDDGAAPRTLTDVGTAGDRS